MYFRGRLISKRYLGTAQEDADTVIASVRDRLETPPLFNQSFVVRTMQPSIRINKIRIDIHCVNSLSAAVIGRKRVSVLWPASVSVTGFHYTTMLIHGHEIWNDWFDLLKFYPQQPFDTVLPNDGKFLGKSSTDLFLKSIFQIVFEV